MSILCNTRKYKNIKFTVLPLNKLCFLKKLHSTSTMHFTLQLGNQATNCFYFFTAALLHINVLTFSRSLIFIKCAMCWVFTHQVTYLWYLPNIRHQKVCHLASWLCKHCCMYMNISIKHMIVKLNSFLSRAMNFYTLDLLLGIVLNFKLMPHFKMILVTSTIFWLPQLHSFCVYDTKFKECLEFEQCVVEKLPSFVKLVFPFRKPIWPAFLVKFVVFCTYAFWEVLGCMAMVTNTRNVTKLVFWNKRQANVTKEIVPQ